MNLVERPALIIMDVKMTPDIDWVIATIHRKLRNSGLVTHGEAEKILKRIAMQTGARQIVDV